MSNPTIHPIIRSINDISKIFSEIGFDTIEGPELESEWNNFDALNVSKNHSSRDMQDTFWIKDARGVNKIGEDEGYVLRTHTSTMQIRTLEKYSDEFKRDKNFKLAICAPGKVFRNEATDATHEAQFHQVEMLYVAHDASVSMLIGVIQKFLTEYFGIEKELKIRLRSSYFPFVEPGNEVDMMCHKCLGSGKKENLDSENCSVCRGSGWIEIGGAGMTHPNVLKNSGIDDANLRGFAFGCGIDRLAMLKYGIDDIRILYNGDLRLINQF